MFCIFIILSVAFCLLPCFKHTTLIAMMNFLEEKGLIIFIPDYYILSQWELDKYCGKP